MGRIIPFGAIPTSSTLADGIYHLKVVELKETMSSDKDGKTAKLMYKLTSEVISPEAAKGQRLFENFVIGTDEDPEALDLATWTASIGGKAFKRFSSKLALPVGDEEDSDTFLEQVKDQEFMATVVTEVDDGKKDPKYKGNVRNKTTAYWAVGEKQALLANTSPPQATKPAAAKTGPKPVAAKPVPAAAPKAGKALKCTFPGCEEKTDSPAAMSEHVQGHMKDLQPQQATGTDDDDE